MSFKKNDKLIVCGFSDDCPKAFRDKIIAMGVIEGQQMKVINKSILGGPIAFETSCGTFSLRKKDLEFLKLEKLS
ncbi:ferrous iron transport protein A [Allofrancisella inopinata]|uniref:Spermidine/putrescine ABC transporter substrate-binding protein n=1 Tax=Allofrancisella inopinata TaxID=1085647 RepID=A0AAE7CR04_9GAMM|nr:FeoA domain-containing protein [Allofrancisella inopinata]QIV96332.1 spermidine/putrescine ABC transporter substrate-binding protein [Allofrancisella inopinata]TDT66682.1 ferrous iron transport protein A [Allofrancisella inopinata]